MQLIVYEVERIRDDGKDEHILKFWYLDYPAAVNKFKKFVEEEKKVDWIEEALSENNGELIESVDYWGIYVEHMLDRMYSEVKITAREVL